MIIDRYHNNVNVTRQNAEPKRAYYVPFGSPDELQGTRDDSSRFKLLSGCKWAFTYFDSFEDIPSNITESSVDISNWDRIPVPSNWQMQGYDDVKFLNSKYDFPRDIPSIPNTTPAGVYAVDFTIHDNIDVYSKYIVFEGVDSSLYLYLNGEFIGFSQTSHSAVEFDVTSYLKMGKNRLTAIVTKWCDGSYLESCDDWKLSGIFRDVYLLVRPKGHVEDVFIKTDISEDYKTASVTVEIECPIANETIVTILNSAGEKIDATVFDDDGTAKLTVEDPRLWSAEYPELYNVVIESSNEFVKIPVGIRSVSNDNGILRLNGRPIKLYGVNYHAFNSKTGNVVSYEDMKKDLIMMKRNNINAIRVADFPADPRFYELCDKIGFYVISESEINCSGMGDDSNRRKIVDNPIWEAHIVDRMMLNVESFKNNPSIIVWSCGNNSGYGRALKQALTTAKARDNTRLYVYQSDAAVENIDHTVRFHPTSLDIISEKYLCVDTVKDICNQIEKLGSGKPFMLSEYAKNCGNGAGGLKEYFDLMENNELFCGAFIYEWSNRAISNGKAENGKQQYLTTPDGIDNNFCCGITTPEGKTLPALKDHKNLAKPFKVTPINLEEGIFNIKNCYFFSYMSRLEGSWELTRNGQVVSQGTIGATAIPPQREEEITLGYQIPHDGRCYLKISFASYGNDFIPDGEIVGFEQFLLPTEIYSEEKLTFGNVEVVETIKTVSLSSDGFDYTYDKTICGFSSLKINGKELLKSPIRFNAWRAVVGGDISEAEKWTAAGLDRLGVYEYDTKVTAYEGFATVTSTGMMAADGLDPVFKFKAEWTVFQSGLIELHQEVEMAGGIAFGSTDNQNTVTVDYLSNFGITLSMDKSFDTVEFFGYGPFDSYCDRHNSSYIGKFTNKVYKELTDYVRPQSSGNHHNTYWGYIRNQNGLGLIFSNEVDAFDFSAVPYTAAELQSATRGFRLPAPDKTVVSVDYKQSGVGADGHKFKEESFIFNVKILPTETMQDYPL